MNLRFAIFLSIVTLLLTLASVYLGHRVIARFDWAKAHRGVIWLGVGLFVVIQLLGPTLYRTLPNALNRPFVIQWITYSTLGIFFTLLFYTVVFDLVAWVTRWLTGHPQDLERRAFIGVGAAALVSVGVGAYQALSAPKVKHVRVPIRNLPPALQGYKIAQISDLHVGPTIGRSYAEKVTEITNALQPDAIALTGDFVDGLVPDLRDQIAPLAELRARHGTYFTTGNHEYYWGADAWVDEMRRLGATPLMNEHRVIDVDGAKLVMGGVTDPTAHQFNEAHRSSAAQAINGAPADAAVRVLLAHQPSSYKGAVKAGFDLQLSGHTHAGQFFPFSLFVGLAHDYYKGLNRHENLWIYVNSGTGYWGPPIRFLVPPEITLIELQNEVG